MQNSFFEYRDQSGDTDSEIIDESVIEESFVLKTPGKKNHTVFVPESDESTEDEFANEGLADKVVKVSARRSSVTLPQFIVSSDDDRPLKESSGRQSGESPTKLVPTSSEDEGQVSPEMIPKRRKKSVRLSESFIGRKTKKRIFLIDSDTDNSIIIEHNKNKKMPCVKDTPAKQDLHRHLVNLKNMSIQSNDAIDQNEDDVTQNNSNRIESGESTEYVDSNDENDKENIEHSKKRLPENNIGYGGDSTEYDKSDDENVMEMSKEHVTQSAVCDSGESTEYDKSDDENRASKEHVTHNNVQDTVNKNHKLFTDISNDNYNDEVTVEDDDDDQDDHLVMSRATRMSIIGILPKDNESDDSDFIQSDDSNRISKSNSVDSLPEVTIRCDKTPDKSNADNSRLTCSPFSSPLNDISNKIDKSMSEDVRTETNDICDLTHVDADDFQTNSFKRPNESLTRRSRKKCNRSQNKENKDENNDVCDLTHLDEDDYSSKTQKNLNSGGKPKSIETVIDDDITIIDNKQEVIALSSDDEDEVRTRSTSKSPNLKKSPKPKKDEVTVKRVDSNMKQYLLPPSYPNQVMYVKKHVRENELSKLNGLREDLQNIKYLLDNMDVNTLPDGGVKLIERLSELEAQVHQQGDKVANMVVEPDEPSQEDIKNDGFNKENEGLSWEDIQKASIQVQPRMFGKQAMTTHMAERNLTLERLRELYESLASRPPESQLAAQPRLLRTELMPHQRHALAWLRWRETQRPRGGLLADDMGLGKTITMISLVASDKENGLGDDEDDEDDDEYLDKPKSRYVLGGTLVVCPASLVQQWAGEVRAHCAPHALSVALHHGAARATHPHRLAATDIVITTYHILQRETEAGALSRVRWRRVVVDEAHAVRNHKSLTSRAVVALRARRRWALTGTPLHNKDIDLFALLKFLRCSPFDDLAVWKKWIDNKSLGGQERLSTIMRCLMLRRTKPQLQAAGQLACLPPREHTELTVTLRQDEMNVYQKVLVFSKTLFAQFLHQRAEKQADAEGLLPNNDSAYTKMHKRMIALQGAKPVKSHEILVLLLRLRQVCCHCGLIAAMLNEDNADVAEDEGSKDLLAELDRLTLEDTRSKRKSALKEEEEEVAEEEGTTAAEAIRSVLSPNNPVFDLKKRSSKINAVMDCLEKNVFPNKGEKAVVVSQWVSVLRLVEAELQRARVRCVTLSGNVPVPARAGLVDALNTPDNDVRVMLLSLCAGGVGLNLCGASHLLLLDPHWNPQLEQQAQDRVYRVGQKRPVNIYSFMCVDTVEQSIRQLQRAKLQLADNVLTGARHNTASKLTIEDLKMLFNMAPAAKTS